MVSSTCGDNAIARPLQMTYRIIQLTNSDEHLLIVELTNPAGSNHESLMRMRDSNGRIEMEEMRKLSNWGKGRRVAVLGSAPTLC